MRRIASTVAILTAILGPALASPSIAQTTYTTVMTGGQEVPPVVTTGTGTCTVVLNAAQTELSITCSFQNLIGVYTLSHIHGPAAPGVNAGVRFGFVAPLAPWVFANGNHDGTITNFVVGGVTLVDAANLNNGMMYVNIHSDFRPGGEIRGQLRLDTTPTMKTTWGRVRDLYR
jgi:hypothetical protein